MSADAAAVVVHAVITPADGRLEAALAAVASAVDGIRAEVGCELYAPHVAPDGTIVIVEKWTSRADLEAHDTGEPVGVLRAGLAGLTGAPTRVTVLEPVLVGGQGDSAKAAL
ncbi:putative quinol monooxygenase [Agromyces allii]|uniref:Antibiotic biosynthesis monooxygenase n=1 Tax=Agromyces allii TaxID=393607 RepID=A0ABN2Q0D4_9MICO|nr:antibiotic biosynthesis monooxygenase [Agromyces allii]